MSHLLFGGTAAFRHGAGALDDVTSAKSAAQRAAQPLVTVLGAESADAPHPAPAAELTSSASVKPAPDAMDAAGQNVSGCAYPTVPFYGLLNELEVTMELPDRSARALAPVLDRTLQATMREAGRVYYLGSQSALQDPDMRLATAAVGSEPPTGGQLRLSYGAYVSALMDGLAQFTLLRSATPTTKRLVTPHTLHVRLGGHPRWKDVSLMLALECGQLVLYVSASSRLTQQFLTTRAARLSLELVWLAGATMVEEPRALQTTDINPVLVLWDCFMALPLLSTAPAAITTTTTTMVKSLASDVRRRRPNSLASTWHSSPHCPFWVRSSTVSACASSRKQCASRLRRRRRRCHATVVVVVTAPGTIAGALVRWDGVSRGAWSPTAGREAWGLCCRTSSRTSSTISCNSPGPCGRRLGRAPGPSRRQRSQCSASTSCAAAMPALQRAASPARSSGGAPATRARQHLRDAPR